MSVGVAWRALCENYAPLSDEDEINLWNRWSESVMKSDADPMLFLGKLDQLSSQMEAANCSLPAGMMESHSLNLYRGSTLCGAGAESGRIFSCSNREGCSGTQVILEAANQRWWTTCTVHIGEGPGA